MMQFFLIFNQAWAIYEVYSESFELTQGQFDNKFDLIKEHGTENSLLLVGVNEKPYLEMNNGKWNIQADYFDDISWIKGYNTMKVSIPGTITGTAYISLYSYSKVPNYSVKNSFKSESACLFTCKNGGACINGQCSCEVKYGGTDCSVYFTSISIKDTATFIISQQSWFFLRLNPQDQLEIKAKSTNSQKFQLFYAEEKTGNELPTMLNSKQHTFKEDSSSFTVNIDKTSNYIRISLYCYNQTSDCKGTLDFSLITNPTYLWVIIFSVIVGVFFVGSIPLILMHCNKNNHRSKIVNIQITKEQMERMYPGSEWEENQNELCPICLDMLKGERLCRKLACLHVFHLECIDEWVIENTECPICKQNVINTCFEHSKGGESNEEAQGVMTDH